MKNRNLDYILGFFICLIVNIQNASPYNIKSVFELIVASLAFSVVFGMLTNFIFKKRKK
jgi:hypothetical protein